MKLETKEEYEAAKTSLTYLKGCTDPYFTEVLAEAVKDWGLVSKAQPHIDAFYEAVDSVPFDGETAEKELAIMEEMLDLNHRECVKAITALTFTQDFITSVHIQDTIPLESYAERLKTVYESGTDEWGWVSDYRCYLSQYHHVSWDTLEEIEDGSLPEPDISRYESLRDVLDGLLKSIPDSNIDWEGYLDHEEAIDKAMDELLEEEGKLNPREQRARK